MTNEVPSRDETSKHIDSLVETCTEGKLPDLEAVKEIASFAPGEDDIAPILQQKDIKALESAQMGMAEFEAQVTLALKTGHQWLEVPKEVLMMVCAGEYPAEHYICYKGLKVAAEGMAKECMAKEKVTSHEKVFPADKFKVR